MDIARRLRFRQQQLLKGSRRELDHLGRYLKAGIDLFPTGKYPVFPDPYGASKCFIVPLSEKAGNPYYDD